MSFGKYGVRSRPTTTLDQVFVTADSHVSALDIESGTVMWAKPLAGFEGTPPTPCGGRVYVGGGRRVVAFDSETGMERWSFTTYDDVQAELLVVDGLVYVAGQDHRLWALDADTGHLLWAFEAERALFAPPVIFNGVLFLATGSWLHVLDAHSGRYLARNDVITDMVRLDGGMLYGVKKNRLLALDASTLDTKWVATVEDKQVSDLFIRSLVVDGAAAYFDTTGFAGRSNLFAIDAQAGTGRWNFLMNSLVWGGLVIGDDNLLVSSHDGVLHAIRK
jgi:outer membrane protein assembly factor BamB